ncbi:MAG TPA: bifunctional adenosylcobinamide kinase/adenosylcobinamide-phosphate guanylyltransferase [Bryobacteraceae bacterium]|nr:bifunctional adenosylcobinamide kinase/adenosylcobinamide-phosphate guanylyltransferase [Bryobacteraceae bacterium]
MLTFIIGGARSGKSRFAQSLCSPGARVVYLATARVEDDEMRARVERHRADRPSHWRTIEEPLAIAGAVQSVCGDADFILLDCLTVWLGNLCWEYRERPDAERESRACGEIDALAAAGAHCEIVLVSNEVGWGIVPEHPLGRQFRDLQGLVNQRTAALADRVFLTVAGIPIGIKPPAGMTMLPPG